MAYAKALVAVLMTIVSAIVAGLTGDGIISPTEWINIAIAATTALAVFTAPNVPGAPVTKAALATIMAILTLAVNFIAGGVTLSEWLQFVVAGAGAMSVYLVPNTPPLTTTV